VGAKPPISAILEGLPMAAAVFDREMRYLAYNARWRALHRDLLPAEILGRSLYEVVPEHAEHWRDLHRRCLDGERASRELHDIRSPSGEQLYFRWSIEPWRDEAGAVGGLSVFVEDVTEQVVTERRLGEREHTIRDFFTQSPVGLNLCRMDGLWLESNPAFLQIIGYTPEEADGGLTYWQLTPRKYDAAEAAQLENLRTTGRYGPYEKEFIRKDGTLVPVRLNGFLVERENETLIWSLIEDMTEQRVLEQKLDEERVKAIQSSKLATLGEMAAGVAHELNNPLAIIELYAFALKSAIHAKNEKSIDEAIDAIRSAVGRAGNIVKGLSRFSRMSSGDRTRVPLATILDDAIGLCRHRLSADGVKLRKETGISSIVDCHPTELSQVLVNLLNNASYAAKASAERWVSVVGKDDGDSAIVTVEDSGGPLGEEVVEKLFRPFFTTKKVGDGTGLGLSISRSIVDRHGGTLDLDRSAPHTRFILRLPRVPS
jgi:PAS domain S-box-containing protein